MVEHLRVSTTRAARGGFTIIEIVVTLLIVGLMLAGISQILTSVRYSRDFVHNVQEMYLAGPAILDLIERDLRGVHTTAIPLEQHLRVENMVIGGEDADRIDFLTTTDSLIWTVEGERGLRADINEVGYCLRTNPNNDDFLEIYRREGYGIDAEPHSGGRYVFLHDRVRGFDIQVYAEQGEESDPVDEWGTDPNDPDSQGLPAYLRITLVLELEPRLLQETLILDKQRITYERIVRLPESLRVAQAEIPRLTIPGSTQGSGSAQEGPGAGEGEGDTTVGGAAGGGGSGSSGSGLSEVDR